MEPLYNAPKTSQQRAAAGQGLLVAGLCFVAFGIWCIGFNEPLGKSSLVFYWAIDQALVALVGPEFAARVVWSGSILFGLMLAFVGLKMWRHQS